MSTFAYAQLTNFRIASKPGSSMGGSAQAGTPGIKLYSDALAALVPAEILTVHAIVISVTTKVDAASPDKVASITDPGLLWWAFWGLCALSVIIYIFPRVAGGQWDRYDLIRMLIPPAAFVCWTMLQPTSAFDVISSASIAQRTVIAVFLAVILGLIATALAYKADQTPKA